MTASGGNVGVEFRSCFMVNLSTSEAATPGWRHEAAAAPMPTVPLAKKPLLKNQ
jgi:hypothetical protein